MVSLFLLLSLFACGLGFPNTATQNGGFKPLPHARGVPQGKVFSSTKTKKSISEEQVGAASIQGPSYGPGFGGGSGFGHGHGHGPTKTIYVNVPPEQYPAPKPIAAGPPRKHYRIVFIRSPAQPPPQPIIPPRVEQKTLIYVLHPRQQPQIPNVVEVPDVKHDPQVYFIQYDDEPPTAEDLQDLVKNTIDSHTAGFEYAGPGVAGNLGGIYPSAAAPTYQDSIPAGNEISILKQKQGPVKKSAPQLLRARPDQRELVKQSPPLRHSPKEKFVRTRSTNQQSQPKIKQSTPAKTNLRINDLANQRQASSQTSHRFTRTPVDPPTENAKSGFRNQFPAKPFRFGAKKPAKKESAEGTAKKESS
ncbi:UNVERIFIED_CONTAM: hypothetical protein RMT77_007086 [Armadillidium vulgare]